MLAIFTACFAVVGSVLSTPVEYYATKYDHIDIDRILNNRRLVNYYTACMLSKGPCPPEGLEFKRILPEALKTNCARCTEKQKVVTLRSIKRLKKEYPKAWAQLEALWDPDGSLFARFEASFKSDSSATTEAVIIGNRFGEDSGSSSVTEAPSTSTTSTTKASSPYPPPKPAQSTQPPSTSPSTPFPTKGGDIQATVSLGTNLVGGLVRGIGNVGINVLRTGVQLTNKVLKNVQRVVAPNLTI